MSKKLTKKVSSIIVIKPLGADVPSRDLLFKLWNTYGGGGASYTYVYGSYSNHCTRRGFEKFNEFYTELCKDIMKDRVCVINIGNKLGCYPISKIETSAKILNTYTNEALVVSSRIKEEVPTLFNADGHYKYDRELTRTEEYCFSVLSKYVEVLGKKDALLKKEVLKDIKEHVGEDGVGVLLFKDSTFAIIGGDFSIEIDDCYIQRTSVSEKIYNEELEKLFKVDSKEESNLISVDLILLEDNENLECMGVTYDKLVGERVYLSEDEEILVEIDGDIYDFSDSVVVNEDTGEIVTYEELSSKSRLHATGIYNMDEKEYVRIE